ncbi:PIN domain-containing protein [Thermoflexus hugenholtzii]
MLIDTDVAIDYLRGVSYARHLIVELWRNRRAYLSVISVYELYIGMRSEEQAATKAFVNACQILNVDHRIAQAAADWYRRWRSRGLTLTTADCLIAGTALVHGLKIATRNTRHYPDPDLRYDLENSLGENGEAKTL